MREGRSSKSFPKIRKETKRLPASSKTKTSVLSFWIAYKNSLIKYILFNNLCGAYISLGIYVETLLKE
jgi:hypothetical protein